MASESTITDYCRDTVFGQLVRLLSRKKAFKFPDEANPELAKLFENKSSETSSPVHHDGVVTPRDESEVEKQLEESNDANGSQSHAGIASSAEMNVKLVDWYGSHDIENPQNWTPAHKLLVVFQICILNFGIYIGSSIYTPGKLDAMEEFGSSETVATLGLSLFVLGYGLGPMIFSPMSEIPSIGRSRIYFWTLFVFVVLQLPTGYAVNMPMFLVFRFLTGFFGGPVLATGGATIIDIYPPVDTAYWIGIFGASGVLGPVLGPLVAGFAAEAKGWRWTIWELAWLSAAVLIVLFFLMPETSAANILYRRAKRLRQTTGDVRLKSHGEIDAADVSLRDRLVVLGRAFTLTFSEPVVFFVDLYCALIYGVLYIWFESFPIVFGEIYGFSIGLQGLVFLGIFVGGIITVPCYLYWVQKYMVPQFSKSPVNPEIVLPPTFFGAAALPICLFWYGWTSRSEIHWMVPLVGSGFFTVSIITLFMPVLSYLGMSYPRYAASVLAGNTLFRASCGVVFPLFAPALFHNLGVGPGNSLLGGLAILFIPIPIILFYYGERIRRRSKHAGST